jgi:hypothetical protein
MKPMLVILSFLGLALTIIPAFLVFGGIITWNTHATLMLAGMILWFVTAPFWLGKKT